MFRCRYWEGPNCNFCFLFVIFLSLPLVILLRVVVGPSHVIVTFLSSSFFFFVFWYFFHFLSFVCHFLSISIMD